MVVENSRFGLALMAIRQNELAAEAAGINSRRWKMRALVTSGAIAAAAGGLYACVLLVVTPDSVFGLLVSAQPVVVTLFGGVASLWGPVIGAAILVPLAESLNAQLGNIIPGIQGVVYGAAIIVIILAAPDGLFWTIRDRWFRRALPEPAPVLSATPARQVVQHGQAGTELLRVENLSRSFGGLRAVSTVSFSVAEGEILGIIGPNGAGKTTLFNVLNGVLAADEGSATLAASRCLAARCTRSAAWASAAPSRWCAASRACRCSTTSWSVPMAPGLPDRAAVEPRRSARCSVSGCIARQAARPGSLPTSSCA